MSSFKCVVGTAGVPTYSHQERVPDGAEKPTTSGGAPSYTYHVQQVIGRSLRDLPYGSGFLLSQERQAGADEDICRPQKLSGLKET